MVQAVGLAQLLSQLARLHPAAAVQDEARPFRMGRYPVDVAGHQQTDAGFGAVRPGEALLHQPCITADALEVERRDDPLLVAEVVIQAADAGPGAVADHFDGGGIDAMVAEAGQRSLEDFVFAGGTAHWFPLRN
ncbi:hypothetical protein D3C72_1723750 [compost metagenome]